MYSCLLSQALHGESGKKNIRNHDLYTWCIMCSLCGQIKFRSSHVQLSSISQGTLLSSRSNCMAEVGEFQKSPEKLMGAIFFSLSLTINLNLKPWKIVEVEHQEKIWAKQSSHKSEGSLIGATRAAVPFHKT